MSARNGDRAAAAAPTPPQRPLPPRQPITGRRLRRPGPSISVTTDLADVPAGMTVIGVAVDDDGTITINHVTITPPTGEVTR